MMVFKCPGSIQWYDGISYDYQMVPDGDVPEGWFATVFEAHDAVNKIEQPTEAPKESDPPTRSELEQKATELGLKFDGRTSDKKLATMIQEALK